MIAGCDEAGAGPGFGDLIASAVILTTPIEGLTDAKQLSETNVMHISSKSPSRASLESVVSPM